MAGFPNLVINVDLRILHGEDWSSRISWHEPIPIALMCQIFSITMYPTGLCMKPYLKLVIKAHALVKAKPTVMCN